MIEDKTVLNLPDSKTIPCLNCKYGCMDYMSIRCPKYPECKPHEVYYESKDCPEQEKIVK